MQKSKSKYDMNQARKAIIKHSYLHFRQFTFTSTWISPFQKVIKTYIYVQYNRV